MVVASEAVRALDEKVRARTFQLMRETLAGVTSTYGATYELQNIEGGAVTVNDPALAEEMMPALKRAVGEANFVRLQPEMGAEDFSYFAEQVPGLYFRLGVSNAKKGIVGAIHTPTFDADEDSLVVGVRTMATLVTDYLERHAGR